MNGNPALPLQAGGTTSGYSVISLQSVVLVLGTTYPVLVTAKFDDGIVVTTGTSVVYTLT